MNKRFVSGIRGFFRDWYSLWFVYTSICFKWNVSFYMSCACEGTVYRNNKNLNNVAGISKYYKYLHETLLKCYSYIIY